MENKQESLFDLSKLNANEISKKLNSSFQGLTEEAKYRLKKDGLNQISDTKKINSFSRLIDSLKNPLIVLLIVLVIVSYSIKEHETTIIIAIMVVISTVISFIQESSADKAAEKLQEMVSLTTTVLRQTEKNIPIKNIVLGDVIKLSAGHIIPADLRILSSNNLYINQSALTGESLPVEKSENVLKKETKNIFDLNNICFMGSYVSSGTALGIVTSTGDNTYFGKLAEKLSEKKEKTAFDEGLNKFTWLMISLKLDSTSSFVLDYAYINSYWLRIYYKYCKKKY
ncbi:MAG: HAD-IC family P-type ATPase [bacterium]